VKVSPLCLLGRRQIHRGFSRQRQWYIGHTNLSKPHIGVAFAGPGLLWSGIFNSSGRGKKTAPECSSLECGMWPPRTHTNFSSLGPIGMTQRNARVYPANHNIAIVIDLYRARPRRTFPRLEWLPVTQNRLPNHGDENGPDHDETCNRKTS
jgi:hypothetical protein